MIRFAAATLLGSIALTTQAATPSYGPQLEGFDYPYPLQRFALDSQGQSLQMSYMDVAPKGQANGHTVVLLHGKNFCGATWERTISELSDVGYRVIATDRVGFCSCSKPRAISSASAIWRRTG